MTKEMAIKGLKENLCSLCAYGSQNMDSCDIRECDNRDYIKTLEQQPSEDCVSRTEVMTEIQLNAKRYSLAKESVGLGQVVWSDNLISINDVLDVIRALPPVTPRQEPKTVSIPKGATNGDVIKAMFPWVEVKEKNNGYEVYFGIGTASQYFNYQWWNAPYEIEGE